MPGKLRPALWISLAITLLGSLGLGVFLRGGGTSAELLHYRYSFRARGGMGAQLQIESRFEGRLALRGLSPAAFVVEPYRTQAELRVNGNSRPELLAPLMPVWELPFRVSRTAERALLLELPENGLQPVQLELLETQARQLAQQLFPPRPGEAPERFRGPCLLGLCDFQLEGDSRRARLVRKTLRGVPVQAELELEWDERGLLRARGSERMLEGAMGAESSAELELERVAGDPGFVAKELSRRLVRLALPLEKISDRQKRALLESRLAGVSLGSLLKEGKGLRASDAGGWGGFFVRLRDFLWLHPESAGALGEELRKIPPGSRVFTSGVNALAAQGGTEAQRALRALFDSLVGRFPRDAASLLTLLAEAQPPSEATVELLRARAGGEGALSSHARLLLGVAARNLGDAGSARSLLAGQFSALRDPSTPLPLLLEAIEALGNSGHEDLPAVLEPLLSDPREELRMRALSALRFVPGLAITERLLALAREGSGEATRKAAWQALEVRCFSLPEHCDGPTEEFLRRSRQGPVNP